jgi:predicted GNAT superfamily acetyltransferase
MIETRALATHAEFNEAVRLQQEIWGFKDVELLPLRLFVVATKIGGQAFGAFDGKRMVGFCLSIPGLKAGAKSYLHSHMLGVLPGYRDSGVGRRLKLAQRDDALARGIDLIEWTFDPLELKNAFFNIERLGAVVRRYVMNQYGTTTSHLHGGLPTDRCVAEWWIGSPRAKAIIAGEKFPRGPVESRITIPAEIAELRTKDPTHARAIQQQASDEFTSAFDRGLAVIGFEKSDQAGTYLLGQWECK